MDSERVIRPKSFVEELMDLITVEGQIEETISVHSLGELINKFYPEYEFEPDGQYYYWYPSSKRTPTLSDKLIGEVWSELIRQQIERPLNLTQFKEPPSVGDTVTFTIKPTSDKKDGQS